VGEGLGPQLLNALGPVAVDHRETPAFGAYAGAIAAIRASAGDPG